MWIAIIKIMIIKIVCHKFIIFLKKKLLAELNKWDIIQRLEFLYALKESILNEIKSFLNNWSGNICLSSHLPKMPSKWINIILYAISKISPPRALLSSQSSVKFGQKLHAKQGSSSQSLKLLFQLLSVDFV